MVNRFFWKKSQSAIGLKYQGLTRLCVFLIFVKEISTLFSGIFQSTLHIWDFRKADLIYLGEIGLE